MTQEGENDSKTIFQVISDKLKKEWEQNMAKFVTFKPVESEKLNKSEPVLKYNY